MEKRFLNSFKFEGRLRKVVEFLDSKKIPFLYQKDVVYVIKDGKVKLKITPSKNCKLKIYSVGQYGKKLGVDKTASLIFLQGVLKGLEIDTYLKEEDVNVKNEVNKFFNPELMEENINKDLKKVKGIVLCKPNQIDILVEDLKYNQKVMVSFNEISKDISISHTRTFDRKHYKKIQKIIGYIIEYIDDLKKMKIL